jgi:hypothetical protein
MDIFFSHARPGPAMSEVGISVTITSPGVTESLQEVMQKAADIYWPRFLRLVRNELRS